MYRSRDVVFAVFVYKHLDRAQRVICSLGPVRATQEAFQAIGRKLFALMMKIPSVKAKVDRDVGEILEKVERDMVDRSLEFYPELPTKGWDREQVNNVLDSLQTMKRSDYEHGRVSGAVYHGGEELLSVQAEAYARYATANQLHPDVFPGVRKMESEAVSMVLNLFNAPKDTGCGTSTSGGTESLLLTCLAARQKAREERGVTEPEILAPITAHAAFDKAAYYFNMKLVHAPIDPTTGRVDIAAVRRLANRNTVLLVGSAPNYPHGVIDDIESLSEIALKRSIPLHVDACLGSFIVPFLEELGYDDAPLFDFRVPGVTSISCDTHKYGFAPKGSSIIMYREPSLRARQYFVSADWSGGIYASPTLAGSRPGALMVGCWASLVSMGREGYLKSAQEILQAAMRLKNIISSDEEFPTLRLVGNPLGPVVAFTSDVINIYDLGDAMSKRGWHLASLQNPAALHMACTRLTVPYIDDLVSDLKACVSELLKAGSSSESTKGTAALYGVAGSIQTVGIADRIAEGFVDNLYKL